MRLYSVLFLLLFSSFSFAWLDGWEHRMPIELGSSSSELIAFQVNITVPYNLHMNSDLPQALQVAARKPLSFWRIYGNKNF